MVFCDVCLHKTNLQELLVAPRVLLKNLDDSLPKKTTTVRSDFQGQVGKRCANSSKSRNLTELMGKKSSPRGASTEVRAGSALCTSPASTSQPAK